jgi:hypothetical protein
VRCGRQTLTVTEPRALGPEMRASDTDRALGPAMRASDADRDAVARLLGAAFAEGRLDADEHGGRIRAAYAARTLRDLDCLTADLPGQAGQTAAAEPAELDFRPLNKCLMCALLIACPPAGIIWLLVAMRQSRAGQRQPQEAYAGVLRHGGTRAEDH